MAEIPETLRGKTCLITGATSGIGRSSALGLAARGARLFLLCRNALRAAALRSEIAERTGNREVEILLADLASQAETRRAAAQFLASGSKVDVANLYFTRELARRLQGTGVTVNAAHPGAVRTELGQNNDAPILKLLTNLARPFFRSPERGAETSIWLCSAPEVLGVTGRYFVDRREREPHRRALDDDASRRLWDASAKLVGLAV